MALILIKKPQEFIEKFEEIINIQLRNEDRAVFEKGPYKLRKRFVNNFNWGQLTTQQKNCKNKVISKCFHELERQRF